MDTKGAKLLAMVQVGMDLYHYELDNESHKHSGPATDSHYKLVLVSAFFNGLNLMKRHQAVYSQVQPLNTFVHALALHCYTIDEWHQRQQKSPTSTNCMGGGNV